MPTRKEFCRCCLAMAVAGLGAPLLFGKKGDEAKKGEEKKEKMIAYCGIVCSDCPAYIATRKNDDALRIETAKKWSAMTKSDIKPADINCDGCPADSTRLYKDVPGCEVRTCARQKKAATCAACAEYSCAKLDKLLASMPEARAVLEQLRKG